MPDRTQWTDPHCPTARAADIIGDRWSLLIVRDAFDGSSRFSQFQRNLRIAKNILTDRLKTLVEQGIFEVRPNEQGTRNEYILNRTRYGSVHRDHEPAAMGRAPRLR